MPDSLDHLRWSRLELEPMTRPRQHSGRRHPLRPDPQGHGKALADETEDALAAARTRRQASGVDPARLLVLRTRFLGTAQQEHLARLGVQVVEEREERQTLDSPVYELLLRFTHSHVRDAFQEHADLSALGITATQDVRGSVGEVDPLRLLVHFPNLDRAKAFEQSGRSRCPFPFDIQGKPRKVAVSVQQVLMVQFPDLATQERVLAELAAYRRRDSARLELTASQRAELFDSLESIERPGPDDRLGARLGKEGPPSGSSFYLDVDLWHPGSQPLVLEAIAQFRDIVAGTGGQVTSNVLPLQHTLLIARVRATSATLDALLNYDRVSRVDLPPRLEPVRFTILNAEPSKAEGIDIPDDGPLACLVDSGVVSGHPLLQGLVVDERDFDSGEHTPVDQVGHGTHLAGIIVYGDIYSGLQSGDPWVPRVRLLSAKVLRRVEEGFGGEWVRPGFEDEKRAEEQIRDAVTTFARERHCRVFNLSVGNPDLPLTPRHQLPWALLLDELAHDLDIVIVVSAGNVASPAIPNASSQEEFQQSVRDQLFSSEHTLIDPACAVNAVTVGAVSRNEVPHDAASDPEARPDFVGSPKDCPAPLPGLGSWEVAAGGLAEPSSQNWWPTAATWCFCLSGTGGGATTIRSSESHRFTTISTAGF